MISKAEDPEKVLEQAVIDMQEDLIQLRQAVARVMAERNRTEQKYKQDVSEASKWEQRAKLALTKGDESLAREALMRKKSLADTAGALKQQLDQQNAQLETLRSNLVALESKISEAKTKKNMLQARAKAAKANEELSKTLSGIDTSSSMSAFERMETKVLEMEASSQAYGELAGTGIEQQFAQLEAGSEVDDELELLKAEMAGVLPGAETLKELPEASEEQSTSSSSSSTPVADAEIEEIKTKLKDI
jgi:phage shock protein A